MNNSKKGSLPFRHGPAFSKEQCPKIQNERDRMARVPYASVAGSLMYTMLYTRLDIYFTVGMVSIHQSNPGPEHWIAVKHILKYLRRTKDYILMCSGDELIPIGYTNSDFMSDKDLKKCKIGRAHV